jgi:hypothetical protein
VLDAVIVHELAHLIEPNHSPRFRELEARYPRRHDADLFLEGYHLGLHMDDADDAGGAGGLDGLDDLGGAGDLDSPNGTVGSGGSGAADRDSTGRR